MIRRLIESGLDLPTFSVYDEDRTDPKTGCLISFPTDQPAPVQFTKTHRIVDAQNTIPAIVILRDGRDCLCSHAHYVRWCLQDEPELTVQQILTQLISGEVQSLPGGADVIAKWSWSKHVKAWAGRANTMYLRYEQVIAKNPQHTLMEICDHFNLLGYGIRSSGTVLHDFESLQRVNAKFYRYGQAGSWGQQMTPEAHDLFWTHHGDAMQMAGYPQEVLAL